MLIHHWDNPQTVHYLDGKVQKGERTIEGSGSVLGSTMEAIDTEAIATDDFSLELVQGKRKVGVQIVAPELRVGTFAVFGDRKGNLGAHSNMPTAHIINWFEDHTY